MLKHRFSRLFSVACGAAALAGITTQAHAAAVLIDDSDPNTFFIRDTDFEGGFTPPSGSVFADGTTLNFSGSYLTFLTFFQSDVYLIAAASAPDDILAELDLTVSSDFFAEVTGTFYGSGSTHPFSTTGTKVLTGLDGGAEVGAPFLGISVRPEIPAAVPEPSAWAMLIGGIGLIGGTMRRRQKVSVAFG